MKLWPRSSRLLRLLIAFCVLALIATSLIGMWCWYASLEWHRLQNTIETEGETFDLMKLLPPAVADSENFGAISALKDIALVIDGDPEKGTPGAKRAALSDLVLNKDHPELHIPRHSDGAVTGKVFALEEWTEFMQEAGFIESDVTGPRPANEMLAAIDRNFPLVAEIASSSDRKQAQFTPGPSERAWRPPLWESMSLKWFDGVFALIKMLRLRAEAAVIAGDAKAAADSIIACRQLGVACGQEPYLIGHLISITNDALSRRALWSALERRVLGPTELERVQSHMARPKPPARLLRVLRTEMCFQVDFFANMKGTGRDKLAEPMPVTPIMPLWVARAMPGGWVDYNGMVGLDLMWRHHIKALRDGGLNSLVNGMRETTTQCEQWRSHVWWRMMLPLVLHEDNPTPNVIAKSIASLLADQQAITAIALERWFFRHQKYPSQLSDLVPEFLPSPPTDELTGKPLGYHLTADGRYMIWSFGFDGVDDGGKVNPRSEDNFSNLTSLDYKGDWTWQYQPIKP